MFFVVISKDVTYKQRCRPPHCNYAVKDEGKEAAIDHKPLVDIIHKSFGDIPHVYSGGLYH